MHCCDTFYIEHIVVAANKALNAIHRMRAGRNAVKLSDRKRAKEEMSSLFHSKRRKVQKKYAWRHKFFCLAYTDQDKCPTYEADKDELYQAGLGEKEIVFEDVNISQEEFHDVILEHFPRLREGGGFRLLKGVFMCIKTCARMSY